MKGQGYVLHLCSVISVAVAFMLPFCVVKGVGVVADISEDAVGGIMKWGTIALAYAVSCWFCGKQAAEQQGRTDVVVAMVLAWMLFYLLTGRIEMHYNRLTLILLATVLGVASAGNLRPMRIAVGAAVLAAFVCLC